MSDVVVRVATFNIRNGRAFDGWNSWPFRRRATLRMIEELDADIIGLQEAYRFQLRWLERHLPGYVVLSGAGRSGGHRGEMCPILLRRDFATPERVTTRWYGATPDLPGGRLPGASFPRIATLAVLRPTTTASTVQIANTHLDETRAANRVASADQLDGWMEPAVPHLVLGDMNAPLGSQALERLLARGRQSALEPADGGTAHGFLGGRDGPQIDHIFFSPHWTLQSAVVAATSTGRLGSDHWPVVAELTL